MTKADTITPAAPAARTLVCDAVHRTATRHDLRAVLQLVADAEGHNPGLFGQASRSLPRRVGVALAQLGVLQSLAAGDLIYDPSSGAALAVIPHQAERRARRTLSGVACGVVVGLACSPALAGAALASQLLPWPLSLAPWLGATAGTTHLLLDAARALRQRRRTVIDAARHGPALIAGSYVARPGARGRLLADLLGACDRADAVVILETTGEARIRLFGSAGFLVAAVVTPRRPHRRIARPPRGARVLMTRGPGGTPLGPEPPRHLWQRPRRPTHAHQTTTPPTRKNNTPRRT